ncbi:MAG: DUF4143 domain-containing protein [Promicromonosporaceae bacterium]|nr:DUF4143 domain-containing protein [Promicromonosporaceae bacterium]
MTYRRRIVDDLLDEVFPDLAAIALEGAKGVGKSATALQRAQTVINLTQSGVRATTEGNPGHLIQATPPVLIDEWQLVPEIWDVVRNAVDADRSGGRFLLAGSASVAPGVRIHSGAGRIVRVKMRPMSIAERGISEPTVSLGALLRREQPQISGRSSATLLTYVDEMLASGFPGIRDLSERARNVQLGSYVDRIVDHELLESGVQVRRPEAMRSWLAAYGAATATDAVYSKILDAATAGLSDKPARGTVDSYREQLARIFVLDPIPAWETVFNPLSNLSKAPKHHLVDPALAARLVGVGKAGLLRGEGKRVGTTEGTWVGALFESLAAQSVRVYAEAVDARVGHLRQHNAQREIDLIVEGQDRSVVAIEVKLSDSVTDHDVRHLNWLKEQLGDRLVDRVLINTGQFATRRRDGVAVVPLALLGP